MKTNDVITEKRKSNHSFLFAGLVVLCIAAQLIANAVPSPFEFEGLEIFKLVILSVVNPIVALFYTLIATIINFI